MRKKEAVPVGATITIDQPLHRGLEELLNELGDNVVKFGDNFASIINQQTIANKLKVDVRTIYRRIETLFDKGIIEEVETKRGRDGGTVLVFNLEEVSFESHKDNPYTGETKRAKEIRDLYYPNKGTYIPDTRTEEQKERQRINRTRKAIESDLMNDYLRKKPIPDTAFFELSSTPTKSYKAYILSRMYNAVLIGSIETLKNEAERDNNKRTYKLAEEYYQRYYHYDVLPRDFVGKQAFDNFERLVDIIDYYEFDPILFFHKVFETFIYYAKTGKGARPPYVNVLLSDKIIDKYWEDIEWKQEFDEEHYYYATNAEVRTIQTAFPIYTALLSAYERPMEKVTDIEEQIERRVNTISPFEDDQIKSTFYNDIVTQIKEDSEMEDEVKEDLVKFFQARSYIQYNPRAPRHLYLLSNFRQINTELRIPDELEEGSREWYAHKSGYYGKIPLGAKSSSSPFDRKQAVKDGYFIDFSLNGSRTFFNVWRTLEETQGVGSLGKNVSKGLAKYSSIIPFDIYGDVDIGKVVESKISTEGKEKKEEHQAELLKQEIAEVKTELVTSGWDPEDRTLWYDYLEPYIGHSPRNGKMDIASE